MSSFKIVETKNFQKIKSKLNPKIYEKIKNIVYPQLKKNPFFGTNIKKLKGEFEGYYRYKIGNYRLFYLIENDKVLVVVTNIKQRQSAYKQINKKEKPAQSDNNLNIEYLTPSNS